MHVPRSAVLGALLDVLFMGAGVAVGWFTATELLAVVWMQTAVPIVTVPLTLVWAAVRAPDDPAVDAGEPLRSNDRELYGRDAAISLAWFFPLHLGVFMVALAIVLDQRVRWSLLLDAGTITIVSLAARSIAASLPVALADARFVRADGFARLADKAKALTWRPYARLVPLHLGTLVLLWVGDAGTAPAAASLIAIVAGVTLAGSLIRYPDLSAPSEDSTGAGDAGGGDAPDAPGGTGIRPSA